MMQSGQSSLIGVLEGRLIHSKSLFILREALVVWHRTDAVDLQTKLVLAKLEQ
jgi:hypothetical protein